MFCLETAVKLLTFSWAVYGKSRPDKGSPDKGSPDKISKDNDISNKHRDSAPCVEKGHSGVSLIKAGTVEGSLTKGNHDPLGDTEARAKATPASPVRKKCFFKVSRGNAS
jgi:hypothetical protein